MAPRRPTRHGAAGAVGRASLGRRIGPLRQACAAALLATCAAAVRHANASEEKNLTAEKEKAACAASSGSLPGLVTTLPDAILSRALAYIPRGYQIAWSSRLWNAVDPAMVLSYRREPLKDVRLFPTGDKFVARGSGSIAVIGDAITGKVLHALRHDGTVQDVLVVPPGDRVVIRAHGQSVAVWDAVSGLPVATFGRTGHPEEVSDLGVFPDGRSIITGGDDGRALIWDIETGQVRTELRAPLQSLEAQQILVRVFPQGDRVLTYGRSYGAFIWNASTGDLIHSLPLHRDTPWRINFCAVSYRGDMVATLDRRGLAVWSTVTGRRTRFRSSNVFGGRPCGYARIRGLLFFPQDDRLLVFGYAESVIWNLNSGRDTWLGRGSRHEDPLDRINTAAISADGRLLVTCSNSLATVWDAADGAALRTLPALSGARQRVSSCAVDIATDLRSFAGWSSAVALWRAAP